MGKEFEVIVLDGRVRYVFFQVVHRHLPFNLGFREFKIPAGLARDVLEGGPVRDMHEERVQFLCLVVAPLQVYPRAGMFRVDEPALQVHNHVFVEKLVRAQILRMWCYGQHEGRKRCQDMREG